MPPRASFTSMTSGSINLWRERLRWLIFSFKRSRVADICSMVEKSSVVAYVRGDTNSSSAIPVDRCPAATRALIIICSSQSRARAA